MGGMWNYMPIDFGDHTLVYMLHETEEGERKLEEAVRVWPSDDGGVRVEWLGRPEHEHSFIPGTRLLQGSVIRFSDADIEMQCEPLLVNYVSVGTGYGMDEDWRHGMYQGPELVVQGKDQPVSEIAPIGQYGVVDHVARFTYGDQVGYGLYEHGFFGPFTRYGLNDRADVAPE